MTTSLIAICVATYRRPIMLAQLLESLRELNLGGHNVHLIIADNDIRQSARDTYNSIVHSLPFASTYVCETTRGLASVRNRLVAEARALGADFIAFIDDDETAHPDWLMQLFKEINRSSADAVMGRQIRWLDEEIPKHIKRCFPSQNLRTGTRIKHFATANVLVRASSLDLVVGPFDTRLNLTGGEDSMLSAQLSKLGQILVWCNEAETFEYVPSSRAKPKYILQRAFRTGTTRSKIVRWSNPSMRDYMSHISLSLGIIAKHSALMIPNAITQRDLLLYRLRYVVSGIAGLAGIISTRAYSHQEYKTVHGG